ncbi:uncharacterized protein BDZ99DRAFT_219449 [Mytilinidion resinicola]|uniref:Uncharacterized protein n=1 Tax=Mytilinidion resinicola TaxID=574789 RepID=A0A6A6XYJ7_9PEZI|nr:uncharacterized protein BDZ99DRAFT_219449 [Mytilinidion resinicola]KAF2801572.1 hypothetical protein BDZ99DRAFT_219449 [Mytilinidion resinicola]
MTWQGSANTITARAKTTCTFSLIFLFRIQAGSHISPQLQHSALRASVAEHQLTLLPIAARPLTSRPDASPRLQSERLSVLQSPSAVTAMKL